MIYATMCVGKDWVNQYYGQIDKFAKTNQLHILTDTPNSFNYGTTHMYDRDVFSYYEKINFILSLSKQYNERITYLDSDYINAFDTTLEFDKHSLYSYKILYLTNPSYLKWWSSSEDEISRTLLSEIDINGTIDYFIPEALISFPPQKEIDNIISDSKKLQKKIESTYNQNTKTRKRLDKYKHGIGYSEGWGITALCIKYEIPIKEISWRKRTII